MSGVNVPGLVYLVILLGVVFLPMVLGRGGSSPGQSDSDSDDGGGGGPRQPRTPPRPPRGGIPLDSAEQSRVRLRDHRRLADRLPARPRRGAPDRERTPVRTPTRS
jgi:hypothetical protein